jgi:acyl-ACP thioesterase
LAVFTKVFRTPYYGLDMEGKLKVGALLRFFQEAAAIHAGSVGIGVSDMLERGVTWVLRRYRVKIHHLPAMGDLTVRTWFEPRKNLISVRLFELSGGDGEAAASAWSGWVALDLKRMRPARLDRVLPKAYYDAAEPLPPAQAAMPEDMETPGGGRETERLFHVRRSELDLNGHTNHTVCFEWAIESIPDSAYDACVPVGLDAEYLAPIKRTGVFVRTKKICSSPLKFAHSITAEGSGTVSARLVTTWEKRGAGP